MQDLLKKEVEANLSVNWVEIKKILQSALAALQEVLVLVPNGVAKIVIQSLIAGLELIIGVLPN